MPRFTRMVVVLNILNMLTAYPVLPIQAARGDDAAAVGQGARHTTQTLTYGVRPMFCMGLNKLTQYPLRCLQAPALPLTHTLT